MDHEPHAFNVVAQMTVLRAYARTLTRNRQDAEDLVQETMTRAYEKGNSLRTGGSLRGWLLSILHNVFASNWRRAKRFHDHLANTSDEFDLQVAPAQEHAVRLAQIDRAFLTLPQDQRAALYLVCVEDMPYQEAATALRIPVGTLMSRLGRARSRLRKFEAGMDEPAKPERFARARSLGRLKVAGGPDAAA